MGGVAVGEADERIRVRGGGWVMARCGLVNDNEGPEGPSLCYLKEMVYQRWLPWLGAGRLLKQSLQ